ncbi:MAG: DUF2093 domain-containing protein [Alphaproteobacteria bacterium]|nr:DUF2093 domain-containing protein [Alphaproteobacteria bacterium]
MHGPLRSEAILKYLSGSFEVVKPGTFVRCAVTRVEIAIEDLRYWSFERQEAYASAVIAAERARAARNGSTDSSPRT